MDFATVRPAPNGIIQGTGAAVAITPYAANQACGTAVVLSWGNVVPDDYQGFYNSYFTVWAYLAGAAGTTNITLTAGQTFYIVDLPKGALTSSDELVAALLNAGGGGPPGGVGPDAP